MEQRDPRVDPEPGDVVRFDVVESAFSGWDFDAVDYPKRARSCEYVVTDVTDAAVLYTERGLRRCLSRAAWTRHTHGDIGQRVTR